MPFASRSSYCYAMMRSGDAIQEQEAVGMGVREQEEVREAVGQGDAGTIEGEDEAASGAGKEAKAVG